MDIALLRHVAAPLMGEHLFAPLETVAPFGGDLFDHRRKGIARRRRPAVHPVARTEIVMRHGAGGDDRTEHGHRGHGENDVTPDPHA